MNEKEWDLAQEMLERFEYATQQIVEAARSMENSAAEINTAAEKIASAERSRRAYS